MGIVVPSFPIQNFVPIAYPGTLQAVNAAILSKAATSISAGNGGVQLVQAPLQSLVVNTVFNWSVPPLLTSALTYINACSLNFQAGNSGAASVLNKIEMVYINNVDNGSDVTVYFPDTGMFITCEAGASGYFPVITNLLQCYVYNGYLGSGVVFAPNGLAATQILFCNFAIPGFATTTRETVTFGLHGAGAFTPVNETIIATILDCPPAYEIIEIEISVISGEANAAGTCLIDIGFQQSGDYTGITLYGLTACVLASAAGPVIFPQSVWRGNFAASPLVLGASLGDFRLYCNTTANLGSCFVSYNVTYNTHN